MLRGEDGGGGEHPCTKQSIMDVQSTFRMLKPPSTHWVHHPARFRTVLQAVRDSKFQHSHTEIKVIKVVGNF